MFIYLFGWSLHKKNSTSFIFVHESELIKLSRYYWIKETVNEVHGLVNSFPCHQAHPFHNRPKSLAEIPISGYPTDRNQAQHFSSLCFYTWPSQLVAAGGEFRSWYGDSSFSSFATELSRSRNRMSIWHDRGIGSLVSASAMNRGNKVLNDYRRNPFSEHSCVFLRDFIVYSWTWCVRLPCE